MLIECGNITQFNIPLISVTHVTIFYAFRELPRCFNELDGRVLV